MRSEMTAFLSDLFARQKTLSIREEAHNATASNFRQKFSSFRSLLRREDAVKSQLRQAEHRLAEVQHAVEQAQNTVAEAERRHSENQAESEALEEAKRKALSDKTALARVADRLEAADVASRRREAELVERNRVLQEQEQKVARFAECAAIVAPLRAFIAEYHAMAAAQGAPPSTDVLAEGVSPSAVASRALSILREVRAVSAAVASSKEEVARERWQIGEREKGIVQREKDVREREVAAQSAEQRLNALKEEVRKGEVQIEEAWRGVEEARAETERREDNIRAKEALMIQEEHARRRKEKGLAQTDKSLMRRERSIRRAHAAVTERERDLERREKELEEEKIGLQNLRTTIDMKEDLLDTRDLELAAREARKTAALESLLHASAKKRKRGTARPRPPPDSSSLASNDGPPSSAATNVEYSLQDHVQKENDNGSSNILPQSEQSERVPLPVQAPPPDPPSRVEQPAQQTSVRRQLAFESSAPRPTTRNQDGPSPTTERGSSGENGDDDESEAAANELLPELVGARALWKERVTRLEAVVANMRENTWSLKPQVQPVLAEVCSKLQNIRLELESPATTSFGSAKLSYAAEQQQQMHWGALLREQLDAVRDMQAGILIALNKEEDALTAGVPTADVEVQDTADTESDRTTIRSTSRSTTHTTDNGEIEESEATGVSVSVSNGLPVEETSVDATLDATAIAGYSDEALEVTEDFGTFASSFQEFRRRIQAQRIADQRDGHVTTRGSTVQSRRPPRHAGDRSIEMDASFVAPLATAVTRVDTRSEKLLTELASIRNELQNITGGDTSHA